MDLHECEAVLAKRLAVADCDALGQVAPGTRR